MSMEGVKVRTFYYRDRSCEACGGKDLEMLWEYSHLTRTRAAFWEFKVTNAICRDCGSVFVSPLFEDQNLDACCAESIGCNVRQDSDYAFIGEVPNGAGDILVNYTVELI